MMATNPAIVWLGLVILLLAIEIATMGLTTIWFAGGAMAAFIAAFCGAGPAAQRGIFIILSFALLALTRPVAINCRKGRRPRTNADSLIGQTAMATKEIDNLARSGEVMIADISWTARSEEDGCVIPSGSRVKICAIEGVKLIVEKIGEEKEER